MALLDARALGDPLVAGVDHLRQFVIGELAGRKVAAASPNNRSDYTHL
jgi:hypothetical protein